MISIITPVYNSSKWLNQYMESILLQDYNDSVEIVIWDDGSTDSSVDIIKTFYKRIKKRKWNLIIGQSQDGPHGPGKSLLQ